MEKRIIKTPAEYEIELLADMMADKEKVTELYSSLSVPSYVHGYSLGIEFIVNWFNNKFTPETGFPKDYFKGGIYVDGKHVLDDYKKYSRNVVVGQNPRARIEPRVDFDYDREQIDLYTATPEVLIRRSNYNKSFFRDYENKLYLGGDMNLMKMNFNFKVRVNTRAQQLDCYNKMKMNFRIGSGCYESLSADFHIPKSILNNVAERVGFKMDKDREIEDPISFLEYMNSHSDIPFLFKMRAINQKPEFFIRADGLDTHIDIMDKLSLDDGERDGKLDFNYHIEMNAELLLPVPAFYIFYSGEEFKYKIDLKEMDGTVPVYTFNVYDIPKVDENGWEQAAYTEYLTDDYEDSIDLNSIFTGDNPLTRAIKHDLTRGLSPKHFLNVKVYKKTIPMHCDGYMDWENMTYRLNNATEKSQTLIIIAFINRSYINSLDISLRNLTASRIKKEE